MDQRIEAFLTDVLALAGEDPEAVRQDVRRALGDCEAIFRAGQRYKHMRDQTALIGRALCRSRVVAEMHQHAPGGRMVLLEFPDTDTARRWWNSTAVKAAVDRRDVLRINSTVVLEGIVT